MRARGYIGHYGLIDWSLLISVSQRSLQRFETEPWRVCIAHDRSDNALDRRQLHLTA